MFDHAANLEIRGPSRQDKLHDGGDFALVDDQHHIIAECIHRISQDRTVDAHATARLFQGAHDLFHALAALGAMWDGYCFCFHNNRDPQKPEREHTGECQAARAALKQIQETDT